jgi:hypothetical protein
MEASDDRTNAAVARRLDSDEERARFIEAEKRKLDKIAEHQAKIAARKVALPSDESPVSELDSATFLHKHPDRTAIHDAIDGIRDLGYLHPIERKALLVNVFNLVKQSHIIDDNTKSDLLLLKKMFSEVDNDAVQSYQGHRHTWINDGAKSKQIPVGTEMPEGWVLGRIVSERMKEHQRKITAAAAIINRNSIGNATGSRWYTDGQLNIQVRPGVTPPEGFILGRHFNIEQKKKLLRNLKLSGSKTTDDKVSKE